MRTIKVYHVTMYYQTLGGIRSFVQTLDKELQGKKIRSEIIPLNSYSKKLKPFRIPILGIYPYLLVSSFFIAFTFSVKTRGEKCLIHAHDILFGGFNGVFIKFMLRRPLVITNPGLGITDAYIYERIHGHTLLSLLNRIALLAVEKFVASHADRIMCVSPYTYNYFLKRGINPAKMKLVRNGVDVEMFKPSRSIFSGHDVTMLYAGRISAEKGVDGLIKVFSVLEKNYENLKLVIVGEGPEKASIEKLVKKLGIDDKVTLLPPVNRTDIIDLYSNSDIVFIPSTFETGTPLTLLESMACERLVIVNSCPTLACIVDNTGIIVPFYDPPNAAKLIKRALDDKTMATMLAKRARERVVENFNWKNCFNAILSTYANVS